MVNDEVEEFIKSFYNRLEEFKIKVDKKVLFDRVVRGEICKLINRDKDLNLKK